MGLADDPVGTMTAVSVGFEPVVRQPHDHIVNVYDTDDQLVAEVVRFLARGLGTGDSVVVVATPEHRVAFDEGLRELGIDADVARASGQFRCLDAEETLARFMVGTAPDHERFMRVIGDVVTRAAAGGRHVRAFGEMVALLWADGNVAGAIDVEALWNELAQTQRFSLYCAYPIASLTAGGDLVAASRVCEHHSEVVAPTSYLSSGPVPEQAAAADQRTELFLPVPSALAAVRRFVRSALASWGARDREYDICLVASELATNAVLHASSAFRVSLRRDESVIRVGVQDISSVAPERRDAVVDLPGGRGIAFVERVSTRWGIEARPHGKVVWAELALAARH
jgi:anti-sigma regulatory factor (Ser/Thr protein kinase)